MARAGDDQDRTPGLTDLIDWDAAELADWEESGEPTGTFAARLVERVRAHLAELPD